MGDDIVFSPAFLTADARTGKSEGGYVFNPADPGGETHWGITWPILLEAIALGLVPADTTIKTLTREQAKVIYYVTFWQRGNFDDYHPAIGFQCYDAAVNHGPGTANILLQRAAGVADDGRIGPMTKSAVLAMSVTDVLMRFVAYRIKFWAKLSTFNTFGRGWMVRAAEDLLYAAEDA